MSLLPEVSKANWAVRFERLSRIMAYYGLYGIIVLGS